MNITRDRKNYTKKLPVHKSFRLNAVLNDNRIGTTECKKLVYDHQPCQLSDLSCSDTYRRAKRIDVDHHDYQKEEVIFDFEEELYYRNCLNKDRNTKVYIIIV